MILVVVGFRLIRRTVEVGQGGGLGVAVCGEMASQPLMAFALLGLGVRELSVNGRSVPMVKRVVRGVSQAKARDAAQRACDAATAEDAEAVLLAELRAALGDGVV